MRKLLDLGDPLTKRDAVAPDLLGPLSFADPMNDGLQSISAAAATPSPDDVADMERRVPNQMQQSSCRLATVLPNTQENAALHEAALASGTPAAMTPAFPDVKTGTSHEIDQTQSLLKSL